MDSSSCRRIRHSSAECSLPRSHGHRAGTGYAWRRSIPAGGSRVRLAVTEKYGAGRIGPSSGRHRNWCNGKRRTAVHAKDSCIDTSGGQSSGHLRRHCDWQWRYGWQRRQWQTANSEDSQQVAGDGHRTSSAELGEFRRPSRPDPALRCLVGAFGEEGHQLCLGCFRCIDDPPLLCRCIW
jgi:hypothetical protein